MVLQRSVRRNRVPCRKAKVFSHRNYVGVAAVACVFSVLLGLPQLATATTDPRATGVRELSDEELAAYHERMYVPDSGLQVMSALPSRHLNIDHLPVVRSQGGLGSCAAFATTYYYKTYQEARENKWLRPDPATDPERIASPMWTYNLLPRGSSGGVSPYDSLALFVDRGTASWEDMPYSAEGCTKTIPEDKEIWLRAMNWRASRMGRIPNIDSASGLAMLKRHLFDGDLAVVTLHRTYRNFDYYPYAEGENGVDNGVYFRDEGTTRESHALTVVGYDDNLQYVDDRTGETRRGALLIVNSWGTNWGVQIDEAGSRGFAWIAYDYLLEGGLREEALIMEDRIGYQPKTIAMVGIEANSAFDVGWNPIRLHTRRGERQAFPYLNQQGAVQREFPIDVTDLLEPSVSQMDLRFFHVWGGVPTLTDFYLESLAGDVLIASDETPIRIDTQNDNPYVPGNTISLRAFQKQTTSGLEALRLLKGAAAFADVNANGRLDLIATGERYDSIEDKTAPSTALWLNQGDGTFEPSAAGFPATAGGGAVWSDVNNSGAPDLWLATEGDTRLYWNDGSGNFSDSGIRLPVAGSGGGAGYITAIDYNRNGRPDLALVNEDGVFVFQQRNDGLFSPITLDARGSAFLNHLGDGGSSGTMAWGDLDGDGYPDLLVTGIVDPADEGGTPRTVLYRNNGDDTFAIVEIDLPNLVFSAIAWTDFNNDGLDDLAISGLPAAGLGSSVEAITRIYQGTGEGNLEPIQALDYLPGLYRGGMHWVDLDHTGRRDLLLTGRETFLTGMGVWDTPDDMFPTRLRVWRNRGGKVLEPVEHDLPGVGAGTGVPAPLAIGDVSGDGSVDFFASGTRRQSGTIRSESIIGYLTRNLSAVFRGDGAANAAPAPPSQFEAEVLGDGRVAFSWDGASDDRTPDAGLRYIIRIGTTEGVWDVASGIVQPCNWGKLVRSGVTYNELPPGEIYWSVRTVDAGLAMSEWSAVQSLSVPDYPYTPGVWIGFDAYPEYGGTTVPEVAQRVERDSDISVTALPAPGFHFSHWSGNGPDGQTENPLQWSATRQALLQAVFVRNANPATPPWSPVTGEFGVNPSHFATGIAEFQGRLYQLGGHGAISRNSYVYFADIQTAIQSGNIEWDWDSGNLQAPWSSRSHHSVEVFDNRLWVIGGSGGSRTANQPLNDVWAMDAERNWTEVTAAADWSARHEPATVVFQDKLWVIGGREHLGWSSAISDVWTSGDGANWTLVTDDPPWRAERAVAVNFDGRLYLLIHPAQATVWNPGKRGEVWTTSDGVSWERLSDNGPWGRYFEAVVHQGRIVVATGPDAGTEYAGQAVWESADGVHWVRTMPQPGGDHWSAREYPALTTGGGHVWLVGGRSPNGGAVLNDVWHFNRGSLPAGMGELRLTKSPHDGGTVVPPVGVYVDDIGITMPLRAEPAAGFLFDRWDGPVVDPNAATTTVTLATETEVNARFVPASDPEITDITLNLQVEPANGGFCRLNSTQPAAGDYQITRNAAHSLQAIPEKGYRFSHWSGPVADPRQQVTTVNAATDIEVTAHFQSQSLAAGVSHTALLRADGTLWVWGEGGAGQSGGGERLRVQGLPPLAERGGVERVAAGDEMTAVLGQRYWNGIRDVLVWGRPWTPARPAENEWEVEPYTLSLEKGAISQLAAGRQVIMVLDTEGGLWAAGSRADGMLGGWRAQDHTKDMVAVHGLCGYGRLTDVVGVAVGGGHVLAVDTQGRVLGWGRNHAGQIDPVYADLLETPVVVQNLPSIHSVAVGRDPLNYAPHSYALDNDGRIWQWGAGFDAPEIVGGLPGNIVSISAGGRHTLALDADGKVYAWGKNGEGQLGDGTRINRETPVEVTDLPPIIEIVAGFTHSVALAVDGQVFAWGDDALGAVSGTPGESVLSPLEIEAMHRNESSIAFSLSAEPDHGGAIFPGRRQYYARHGSEVPLLAVPAERYRFSLWGGNVFGMNEAQTVAMITGNTEITAHFELRHDADARLTMAVDPAGGGYSIPGAGEYDYPPGTRVSVEAHPLHRHVFTGWTGSVADPGARETEVVLNRDQYLTAGFSLMPLDTTPGLAGGSFRNLLVLYDNGSLFHLQGDPEWISSWSWIRESGRVMDHIVQAANGITHYLALHADGYVYSWGRNREGQCGHGMFSSFQYPDRDTAPVLGPDEMPILRGVRQVAAGHMRSLALVGDGRVMQWGNISGYPEETSNRPVLLIDEEGEAIEGVIDIAAGGSELAAVRADGTVWTWSGTEVPSRLEEVNSAVKLSLGENHALALLGNGNVVAWGDNQYGQLGQGHMEQVAGPVTVPGLSDITAVSAGPHYNLALNTAGQVFAWGVNRSGQLGDGTQDDRAEPVKLTGLPEIREIAAIGGSSATNAGNTSFALDAGGHLHYWGAVHTLNPHAGVTLLPKRDDKINVGDMDIRLVRLDVAFKEGIEGGAIFPEPGSYVYNPGTEVEFRAVPKEDYRFVQWSDGVTSPRRTLVLEDDRDLTAEFVLIEPTMRLEHVKAFANEPVQMRLLMEDGKEPYAGFNAALHLPPGINLARASRGGDVSDAFRFDYTTSPAPDGGTLLSLVVFSADASIDGRNGEWAVLTFRTTSRAEGGTLPISWVDGSAWTGCPDAVLAQEEDLGTIRPTRQPGSITIEVENRVHAALRIAAHPAAADRMSRADFAGYLSRTHYRQGERYVAEIWLRVTGSGDAGVESAYMNLVIRDAGGELEQAIAFEALQHGGLFDSNTGGTIENSSLRNFGGKITGTSHAGRGEWVRLGWVEVLPVDEAAFHRIGLSPGDEPPTMAGSAKLDDMAILGSPVTVRIQDDLPLAAKGTPHWWLDEYGLVEPGILDYDAAEQTDFRGDGITAHQAYVAGIHPRNTHSRFVITEITYEANQDRIAWLGVAGRRYWVYRTTTLVQPNWEVLDMKDSHSNRMLTYTREHADGTEVNRFYRVGVELIP